MLGHGLPRRKRSFAQRKKRCTATCQHQAAATLPGACSLPYAYWKKEDSCTPVAVIPVASAWRNRESEGYTESSRLFSLLSYIIDGDHSSMQLRTDIVIVGPLSANRMFWLSIRSADTGFLFPENFWFENLVSNLPLCITTPESCFR